MTKPLVRYRLPPNTYELPSRQGIDRYGRIVGKVWVSGLEAGLGQIRPGMAWVYRQYGKDEAYSEAEETARASGIGGDPEGGSRDLDCAYV